jgi:membrane protease YdiL (CAAX protease family)
LSTGDDGAERDAAASVEIPQYSLPKILAVWAAAALPMGALSWIVAPILEDSFGGEENVPLVKALLLCLTLGLIWQFILVVFLVRREQGTLRWSTVRDALWLRAPRDPNSGRRGGRVWLVLIPLLLAFFVVHTVIPAVPQPENRDFAEFLSSDVGKDFLDGAWGWFVVVVLLQIFNTVLGEELLFRGLLLPRMNGVFGRGDWAANGVIFAGYHLHVPWAMPAALLDMFILAYPTKRYRSAWIGIVVHSAQSVFITLAVLSLVA